METNSNEMPEGDEREEEGDATFDPWSDEGARLFNAIADEGRDYISANTLTAYDFEEPPDAQPSEYWDPELVDPDEDTLPPDDMKLIDENTDIL